MRIPVPHDKELTILGLMSGTSSDGLDMALVTIKGVNQQTRLQIVAADQFLYTPEQKKRFLAIIQARAVSPYELSQFNFYLAHLWADAIKDFLQRQAIAIDQVDAIASHGITLWHQPQAKTFIDRSVHSTLQVGDPSVLAQLTGITVVGDFRVADMAVEGQGAPLIPFFDWVYFGNHPAAQLLLNLGGIANITFLPSSGSEKEIMAFDCGPANMLIDAATQLYFKQPYDHNGTLASRGVLNKTLLQFLKQIDSFPTQTPPKSTGREHYNKDFFQRIISFSERQGLSAHDVLHTLTFYTAWTVHLNYNKFVRPHAKIERLIISGGGARNRLLKTLLQRLFKQARVVTSSELGLDDRFKEAVGFAVLANQTLRAYPANVPAATGAKSAVILGKICLTNQK